MRDVTRPRPWPATERADEAGDADSDGTLVAAALCDRRAFAPLYRRYAEPAVAVAVHRLGRKEAAEDAASQTFARALAGLAGFRGGGERSFPAWLFAIAHNVVASAARRPPDYPLAADWDAPDPTPSPEDLALAGEDVRALAGLLARLTPDQRRVVELRLAGLTGAEIAAALGRSLPAVKMLQARALARLRAERAAVAAVAAGQEVPDGDR